MDEAMESEGGSVQQNEPVENDEMSGGDGSLFGKQGTEQPSSEGNTFNSFNCSTCHANWYGGNHSDGCAECGGFALQRMCPICEGKCGAVWKRSIRMSNKMKEAYWDGTCNLPYEVQMFYLLRTFRSSTEDDLVEAMEDLSTK